MVKNNALKYLQLAGADVGQEVDSHQGLFGRNRKSPARSLEREAQFREVVKSQKVRHNCLGRHVSEKLTLFNVLSWSYELISSILIIHLLLVHVLIKPCYLAKLLKISTHIGWIDFLLLNFFQLQNWSNLTTCCYFK